MFMCMFPNWINQLNCKYFLLFHFLHYGILVLCFGNFIILYYFPYLNEPIFYFFIFAVFGALF